MFDSGAAPIAKHVEKLEGHIERMYSEMVAEFEEKKAVTREIGNKDLKLDAMRNELSVVKSALRDTERRLSALQAGLEAVMHTDSKHIENAVKALYNGHFDGGSGGGDGKRGGGKTGGAKLPPPAPAAASTPAKDIAGFASPMPAGGGSGNPQLDTASAALLATLQAEEAQARALLLGDVIPVKDHQATVEGAFTRRCDAVSISPRAYVFVCRRALRAEIMRQKDRAEFSAVMLKKRLGQVEKEVGKKSKQANDDTAVLIECVSARRLAVLLRVLFE